MGRVSDHFHVQAMRFYREDLVELQRLYPGIPMAEVIRELLHKHVLYLKSLAPSDLPTIPPAPVTAAKEHRHADTL